MRKLLDTDHPFFIPVWRRVAVTAACAGWSLVEWSSGSPFWGTLTLGLAAYCVWAFFIAFAPREPDKGAR